MNRAQRRQAARETGWRGEKSKRQRQATKGRVLSPKSVVFASEQKYVTPDGKELTREEFERVVATAERLRQQGIVISDGSGLLWTPEQQRQ